MNYGPVNFSPVTDRRTDRKRCIWAHHGKAHVGSINIYNSHVHTEDRTSLHQEPSWEADVNTLYGNHGHIYHTIKSARKNKIFNHCNSTSSKKSHSTFSHWHQISRENKGWKRAEFSGETENGWIYWWEKGIGNDWGLWRWQRSTESSYSSKDTLSKENCGQMRSRPILSLITIAQFRPENLLKLITHSGWSNFWHFWQGVSSFPSSDSSSSDELPSDFFFSVKTKNSWKV